MKPKLLPILERAIEEGTNLGYNRAFKHTDAPDETLIKYKIYEAIMEEIHEWFEFDE